MKYRVQGWGDTKTAGYSSFSVCPDGTPSDRLSIDTQTAVFPVNYDRAREEQARMLANKVCAFLNELEEKKTQLLELMTIGGQG